MTKILIVDDNQQNRYMLQTLLEGNGYRVETAANGAEALEHARREPPALVITDILMPVMDGFILCREWQQDEHLREIPFVFYTATYTDPEDEAFALSLGAERFIAKPIEPDALVAILREVIREAEAGELRAPGRSLDEEAVYLKTYSERLVNKLENKILQLKRATRRLHVLYEASTGLAALKSPDELVARVLRTVVEAMDFPNGTYFAYDEDREVFRLEVAVGFPDELVETFRRELVLRLGEERGLVGLVGKTREPLNVADTQADPRWIPLGGGIRSALFVPVVHREALLGVANFLSTQVGAFDEGDARNVMTLANNLGIAIENARLVDDLRSSEERYRTLFDSAADAIFIHDLEGRFLEVNRSACERLGYSRAELLQMSLKDIDTPDSRARIPEKLARLRRQGHLSFEAGHLARDGTVFSVEINSRLIEFQGQPAVLSIARDVTRRRQAEDALRESEEKFRTLAQTAPTAIFIYQDTGFRYVNPGAEALTGYAAEELLEMSFWDVVHPRFRDLVRSRGLARQKGEPIPPRYEFKIITESGQERWLDFTAGRITFEGQPAAIGAAYDITERKRKEARLRTLREIDQAILAAHTPEEIGRAALRRLRRLIPCGAAGIVTFDLAAQEATVLFMDAEGESELTEGVRLPLQDVTAVDRLQDGEVLLEDDLSAVPEPAPVFRALQAAGVRSYIAAPLMAEGELIGALGLDDSEPSAFTDADIAVVREVAVQLAVALHQARLQAELETERERLAAAVEHVPEGILLLDAERRILLANPAAQSDLAFLAEADVGGRLERLGHRALDDLLDAPPEGRWHELAVDDRVFEIIARPVGAERLRAAGWVVVLNDVTERRQRQAQAHRQERLAAVGQLAGGIAHDFRNFLATIILYAEVAARHPDLPLELASPMETIIDESRQASTLVQQILDFSRRSRMKTQPLDLQPFVEEAVGVLERSIPERITVLLDVGSGDYVVEADPTRVQQVLMNLALNARDAMPEGGELRISLERTSRRPPETLAQAEPAPGDWVCLAVSDTGTGMTEEVQSHVFEPFFTTKGPGMGTGLGLAQVHGIVEQHGGFIDVESTVGVGSTFRVYLPAHDHDDRDLHAVEEDVEGVPCGHGERILLVEDEERVREAVRASLVALDYEVVAAADGRQALELCEERQPALVITDVVMPQMDGRALVRALRERHPGIKTLVMTGYTVNDELEDLEELGITGILEKPFEVPALARAVRRALTVS